jgi:hypothetical protein
MFSMNLIVLSTAALAVTFIFCLWQAYVKIERRRRRNLHRRVAYMMWEAVSRSAGVAEPRTK